MATLAASRSEEAVNVLQVRLVIVYVDGSQFGPEPAPVGRFVLELGCRRGTPHISRMGHADGDGKVMEERVSTPTSHPTPPARSAEAKVKSIANGL